MSKINPIRKAMVKKELIKGKSARSSLLKAGYSPATAHNATFHTVVKRCREEIMRDFQVSDLTIKRVLIDLAIAKGICLRKKDMANYLRTCELEGKYLAMFTDRVIDDREYTPQEKQARLHRLRDYFIKDNIKVKTG